jgi:hypothetical protein
LGALYQQILLKLGDYGKHGQLHLAGGRREIQLAKVEDGHFIGASRQRLVI